MYASDNIVLTTELIERYCPIVNRNIPLSKVYSSGAVSYICLSSEACNKQGACRNTRCQNNA